MSVFHLAAIDFSLIFSILWTLLIFIQGKTIGRCRGMSKLCSSCFISCQTVIFSWQVNMTVDLVWYFVFFLLRVPTSRCEALGGGFTLQGPVCTLYRQGLLTLCSDLTPFSCQHLMIQEDSYSSIYSHLCLICSYPLRMLPEFVSMQYRYVICLSSSWVRCVSRNRVFLLHALLCAGVVCGACIRWWVCEHPEASGISRRRPGLSHHPAVSLSSSTNL